MTLTLQSTQGVLTVIGLGLLVGFGTILPVTWWNRIHDRSIPHMDAGVYGRPSLLDRETRGPLFRFGRR